MVKMGKWITKTGNENSNVSPRTPGFLLAKDNLPPGWYTHRYRGG